MGARVLERAGPEARPEAEKPRKGRPRWLLPAVAGGLAALPRPGHALAVGRQHQPLAIGAGVGNGFPQLRAAGANATPTQIAGFRDIVVHQYERVDLPRVWQIVTEDLVRLAAQLAPLVPPERR